MTTAVEQPGEKEPPEHKRFNILVNKKHVVMDQETANGAQIKAAAIAQGVPIQPDFNLFIIEQNDSLTQVGDAQTITLHEGEHFSATAPDDNS